MASLLSAPSLERRHLPSLTANVLCLLADLLSHGITNTMRIDESRIVRPATSRTLENGLTALDAPVLNDS